MSWKGAQDYAQRILDQLQLPKDLTGKAVDLRAQAKEIKGTETYVIMVKEALRRKLKARNAREILID